MFICFSSYVILKLQTEKSLDFPAVATLSKRHVTKNDDRRHVIRCLACDFYNIRYGTLLRMFLLPRSKSMHSSLIVCLYSMSPVAELRHSQGWPWPPLVTSWPPPHLGDIFGISDFSAIFIWMQNSEMAMQVHHSMHFF